MVVRVVDGDVMMTHYVPAEAYSAFLAGVLAEADGRAELAYSRYADAVSVDPDDALVLSSLARVACKLPGRRKEAKAAMERVQSLDPSLAAGEMARSECALVQKDAQGVARGLLAAASLAPRNAELDARANRELGKAMPDAARARMLAATRAYQDRPDAWEALLSWSLAHGETTLALHAGRGLFVARRGKFLAQSEGALALAGVGFLAGARELAELAVNGKPDGAHLDSLVARLAVDGALVRRDRASAQRLAARGHVGLGEVAARAFLLGDSDGARAIATEVAGADPKERDAAGVMAVLSGAHDSASGRALAGSSAADLSAAAFIVIAGDLALRAGPEVAALFGRGARHAPRDGRDALVTDAAVELAAIAVLSPETDAERVELALRQGETAPLLPDLDARHELATRLLRDPDALEARTSYLLGREGDSLGRDPLVTFATLERARRTRALTPSEIELLTHAGPHPLLLALRVNLARKGTLADDKRRLAAFARTPYERHLSEM